MPHSINHMSWLNDGLTHEMLVLIAVVQKPPLNAHSDVFSGAGPASINSRPTMGPPAKRHSDSVLRAYWVSSNFGLSLPQLPYFVTARIEGPGENARMFYYILDKQMEKPLPTPLNLK